MCIVHIVNKTKTLYYNSNLYINKTNTLYYNSNLYINNHSTFSMF